MSSVQNGHMGVRNIQITRFNVLLKEADIK